MVGVLTAWMMATLAARPGTVMPVPAPEQIGQPEVNPGNLPLSFVPNHGQVDSQVVFEASAYGGRLFFTPAGVALALPTVEQGVFANLHLQFEGAAATSVEGLEQLSGTVSYMKGDDPAQWQMGLPTYGDIVYRGLYPGIDLHYTGSEGLLKGNYYVAPGADPGLIRWHYAGAEGLSIAANGDLLIGLGGKEVVERAPIAWQEQGGTHTPVAVRYVLARDGSVTFALGNYNPSLPLTIDPTLEFSTFIGGTAADTITGIAVDPATGDAYLVGTTSSASFPVPVTPATTTLGTAVAPDVFVAKINATGTAIAYRTIVGGGGDDGVGSSTQPAPSIALGAGGSVTIAGTTDSTNFPLVNQLNGDAAGTDIYIFTLNATGTALSFSSYFGGNQDDNAYGIASAGANEVVVVGSTSSTDVFINPLGSQGGRDAIALRVNTATPAQVYTHRIGGLNNDDAYDVAVDAAGKAYFTGTTESTTGAPLFPTAGTPFQGAPAGAGEAFLVRLNAAGNTLEYSSFIGGAAIDVGRGIALNGADQVYLTGATNSANFPGTAGGSNAQDAFVLRMDLTQAVAANQLIFGRYLGSTGTDTGFDIATDATGAAFVSGVTNSATFLTINPLTGVTGGGQDAFVTRYSPTGNVIFSTRLGGTSTDTGNAVASASLTGIGTRIYIAGTTFSDDLPVTAGSLQPTKQAGSDGFLVIIGNRRPILDLNGTATTGLDFGPVTYTENDPATAVVNATALTLTDDDAQLASAQVRFVTAFSSTTTLTPPDQPNEILAATASGALTAGNIAYNAATGILTITGPAPIADFQAVLRSVTYRHTSDIPTAGNRFLAFTVDDGVDTNLPLAYATVNVVEVNDPPVNTLPATGPTVAEEGTVTITGLSVTDLEALALNLPVQVTLSVPSSAGTVNATDGGSGAGISGGGFLTNTVTIQGSIAAVNTALTTAQFRGALNANGQVTLTMRTSDLGARPAPAQIDTDTLAITVTPVNDAPAAVDDTATTAEETAVTINVIANDNDNADTQAPANPTGYTFAPTIALVTPPPAGQGTVTISNNQFVFTPALNFVGTASFTYNITDNGDPAPGGLTSNNATVTITVTPVNDAPTITVPATAFTGTEDQATPISLTGITVADVDVATGTMTVTVSAFRPAASLGTLTATGTGVTGSGTTTVTIVSNLANINTVLGTLAFVPAPNANGSLNLTITANDQGNTGAGGPLTATAQIPLNITPENDTPAAIDDTATGNEDQAAITINVLANDNDNADVQPPANPAGTYVFQPTVNLLTSPPATSGTLTQNGGVFTFTPAANFNGTVTFTYNITDNGDPGTRTSANATVTITVAAVNDAPVFTKGADQTVNEDAPAQAVANWATAISPGPAGATDELNQTITFSVTNNTNPTLFQVQPTVASNGTLSYTPAANAFGTATISLIAIDNGGTANGGVDRSAPQSFTITINPVNDPPVVLGQTTITVPEDAGPQSIFGWASPGVPANEATQNIRLRIGSNTNPALFTALPTLALTSTLRFQSAPNAFGSAVLEVGILDDGGTANGGVDVVTTTLTINVTPVNDPPVAANDPATAGDPAFTTAEDTSLTIPGATLTANDTDVDNTILTVSAVGTPSAQGGSVSVSSNSVTYTPALNFFGTDTFTYTVSDGAGGTGSATVTITVTPVNDAPVAGNDNFFVIIDSTNTPLDVLANDTDVDNDSLIVSAVTTPASGTLTISPNGKQLLYTPARGFRGNVTFNYTVSDGNGGTATATVSLRIDVVRLYLPIVRTPPQPELVGSFTLNPANPQARQLTTISAVVTNTGTLTTTPFWVDIYINPRTPPKINEPWNELCADLDNCLGIAWYVDRPLPPGGSITLVSVPRGSEASNGFVSTPTRTYLGYEGEGYSVWTNGFQNPGTYELYLYVDVWNRDTSGTVRDPNGAVREINENNNLTRRTVTVPPAATTSSAEIQAQPLPRFTPAPRYLWREAQEQ